MASKLWSGCGIIRATVGQGGGEWAETGSEGLAGKAPRSLGHGPCGPRTVLTTQGQIFVPTSYR